MKKLEQLKALFFFLILGSAALAQQVKEKRITQRKPQREVSTKVNDLAETKRTEDKSTFIQDSKGRKIETDHEGVESLAMPDAGKTKIETKDPSKKN